MLLCCLRRTVEWLFVINTSSLSPVKNKRCRLYQRLMWCQQLATVYGNWVCCTWCGRLSWLPVSFWLHDTVVVELSERVTVYVQVGYSSHNADICTAGRLWTRPNRRTATTCDVQLCRPAVDAGMVTSPIATDHGRRNQRHERSTTVVKASHDESRSHVRCSEVQIRTNWVSLAVAQ